MVFALRASLLHQPTAPPGGSPRPQIVQIHRRPHAGDGETTQIGGRREVDGACVPTSCSLGQCPHPCVGVRSRRVGVHSGSVLTKSPLLCPSCLISGDLSLLSSFPCLPDGLLTYMDAGSEITLHLSNSLSNSFPFSPGRPRWWFSTLRG